MSALSVHNLYATDALDQASRDALALISAYLDRAYDTIRTGPLGQEDAQAVVGYLDGIGEDGLNQEVRATAREAAGVVRDAIARARENAWDFGAFRDSLRTISDRIRERARTGDNMAGSALDLSPSEKSWGAKVAEDERLAKADECSFSAFLTGERSLSDAWGCVPAPVKYGFLALLGLAALGAARRR